MKEPRPPRPRKGTARKDRFPQFILVLFAVVGLARAATNAFAVAQFLPEGVVCTNENEVVGWGASYGRGALVPEHPPGCGWSLPRLDGGGISFAGATPLGFSVDATGSVARAFIVADCPVPSSWSTLLDAPSGTRLAPRMFGDEPTRFFPTNCLGSVEVSVDGLPGETEMPTNGIHLVEIAFPDPPDVSDVWLGGSPATPAWHRSWPGRIHEAVFFASGRPGEEAEIVRAYLGFKWDLPVDGVTTPVSASRLRSLGLDSGALYSTLLLVR